MTHSKEEQTKKIQKTSSRTEEPRKEEEKGKGGSKLAVNDN